MKPGFFLPTLFAALVLFAAPGHCETPHLIKPIPADQAVDVSVTQGRIVLMFDQNMKMDSWSLMESGVHPFPPMLLMDEPWLDPLTFELKVKALQPGTTYAIQLNGNKRKGFVAAQDQLPLPVTTITFTTAAEGVLPADKAKPAPQVQGAPPLANSQGNQDPTANGQLRYRVAAIVFVQWRSPLGSPAEQLWPSDLQLCRLKRCRGVRGEGFMQRSSVESCQSR